MLGNVAASAVLYALSVTGKGHVSTPRHRPEASAHGGASTLPAPLRHTSELVFVGCFSDDDQRDVGEREWRAAVARGRMTTAQCALACADSAWFAMQRGLCQCVSSFATGAAYKRLEDAASECGPICAGESGLPGTPRYCADGPAARNAIYSHTSCSLGGAVELELSQLEGGELGRSSDGELQWRGRVKLESWAENALLTLDFGHLDVELYSVWGAQFANKQEKVHGPRVTLTLRGQRLVDVGFKVGGAPLPTTASSLVR